jgi:hypothetical protein
MTLRSDFRNPGPVAGLAICLVLLISSACSEKPADKTRTDATAENRLAPEDVLLVVDGVSIRWSDVEQQVAWLDGLAPEYSLRKKIQRTLSDYTLPVLFARRDFAEQRRQLFELAQTVRAASGNVEELRKNASDRPMLQSRLSVGNVELPVAAFLFDPTRVGAVSDPIEVPAGYLLVGCVDLTRTQVPMEDTAECVQVGFVTHDAAAFREWETAMQQRIADRVTFVHPEFRLAMPPWLNLP